MIPILIGTSFLIFVLFALLPGDYIDSNPKLTPERAHELRQLYGLDKPILERYVKWFTDLVKGDFGFSLKYQEPVTSLLNKFIWNSFLIAAVSLFFTWTIALFTGVISAVKQYSWFDGFVTLGVFAAMSFPSFLLVYCLLNFLLLIQGFFQLEG